MSTECRTQASQEDESRERYIRRSSAIIDIASEIERRLKPYEHLGIRTSGLSIDFTDIHLVKHGLTTKYVDLSWSCRADPVWPDVDPGAEDNRPCYFVLHFYAVVPAFNPENNQYLFDKAAGKPIYWPTYEILCKTDIEHMVLFIQRLAEKIETGLPIDYEAVCIETLREIHGRLTEQHGEGYGEFKGLFRTQIQDEQRSLPEHTRRSIAHGAVHRRAYQAMVQAIKQEMQSFHATPLHATDYFDLQILLLSGYHRVVVKRGLFSRKTAFDRWFCEISLSGSTPIADTYDGKRELAAKFYATYPACDAGSKKYRFDRQSGSAESEKFEMNCVTNQEHLMRMVRELAAAMDADSPIDYAEKTQGLSLVRR